MMSLHCDAKALRDQGAQLTLKEQNTLAEERGAKRCRTLTKLPSGEGVRRTRDHQRGAASKEEVHTLAALESHPLPKGHAYSTADLAAMKAKGHGSQAATGPTEREEQDVEEAQAPSAGRRVKRTRRPSEEDELEQSHFSCTGRPSTIRFVNIALGEVLTLYTCRGRVELRDSEVASANEHRYN